MYNHFIFGVEVFASAIILLRACQLGSQLAWNEWKGHPLQFIGISAAYPLLVGGAIGILLDRQGGYVLLLLGVMLLILSDRRRQQ